MDPEYAEPLAEAIGPTHIQLRCCASPRAIDDPEQYRRIVWEGEYPTC